MLSVRPHGWHAVIKWVSPTAELALAHGSCEHPTAVEVSSRGPANHIASHAHTVLLRWMFGKLVSQVVTILSPIFSGMV